jgi:hypothetical protein
MNTACDNKALIHYEQQQQQSSFPKNLGKQNDYLKLIGSTLEEWRVGLLRVFKEGAWLRSSKSKTANLKTWNV